MRTLIVIPTYNEKENIQALLTEVLELNKQVEVLVVDDNSPDGTSMVVKKMDHPRVHLLLRQTKEGLGRAYVAGFAWGIAKGFEALVEMDADFSHRPVDLQNLLKALETCDFVVGSRYVRGGATVNWGILRKLISKGGGLYSRLILGFPLNDWTGGFNAWRTKVVSAIGVEEIKSNGYSFQIELKYRSLKKGFKGCEVPITFEERRRGKSKMSLKIVVEAFYRVWQLKLKIS
jgi:dolichol-phosphate mannosyltransferase